MVIITGVMTSIGKLNDAMCNRQVVKITTKKQGTVTGIPHSMEEYDSERDMAGCAIWIDENTVELVYYEDIISIDI